MIIGLFTATYLDLKLEEVCTMAANLGYQAVELPAFAGNPHLNLDEILQGNNAQNLIKMIASHGLIISALSNHPEGQIVLGPYGKDTDAICPGSKEEKIKFGTERMIKTAQAANALGVPVVTGFIGCENFGRFFPWPYSKGWADMEEEFVERWGKILDKFGEYGVKFAHEPHPNELVYNVETALRAVELMGGRKELGFNFDPANLIYLVSTWRISSTSSKAAFSMSMPRTARWSPTTSAAPAGSRRATGSDWTAASASASPAGALCRGRKSSPSSR